MVHKHSYHPESQRLFSVLGRASPEECSNNTLKKLEEVERKCSLCQRLSDGPGRFRVSLPEEDILFSRTFPLDLFSLHGDTTLYIVDKDTNFGAAEFLPGESVEDFWRKYYGLWEIKYVGNPSEIHADAKPQFRAVKFKGLLNLAGINLKLSGIESHNDIGVGDRNNSYLRSIYKKMKAEHPKMDKHTVPEIAMEALNEKAGPNGLLPILLVFGVMPRLPV